MFWPPRHAYRFKVTKKTIFGPISGHRDPSCLGIVGIPEAPELFLSGCTGLLALPPPPPVLISQKGKRILCCIALFWSVFACMRTTSIAELAATALCIQHARCLQLLSNRVNVKTCKTEFCMGKHVIDVTGICHMGHCRVPQQFVVVLDKVFGLTEFRV